MDWTLAGSVILTGLVLVFVILIILILAVMFTSRLVNGASARTAAKPKEEEEPVKAAAKVPNPVIQDGIEEETVAVISAAVCSYMSEAVPGAAYAIKSVSRATGGRPVWGFAGMQQNTRPF